MRNAAILISMVIVVSFLVASALQIHPFGYPPSQMDDYFIENAQRESGANNAVTAVVFDYRAYDTLVEATILFTAVAAVVMLFRIERKES